MEEFARIKRLPPYVFNVTGELKLAARRRGEDVIDFSMGNPDQPTPRHIVDKLIESVQRPDTHGYSVSKGIVRLRRAICNWYKTRYNVELDPDSEAIVTIGSKEGIAHLALATLDTGDIVLVPNPSYPIHIYGPVIAGAVFDRWQTYEPLLWSLVAVFAVAGLFFGSLNRSWRKATGQMAQ